MSSLHITIFLTADNSKSRRCLEHTLKVVVAIYIVEYKIGVFLHYLGHFGTRINEFKRSNSYRYRIKIRGYIERVLAKCCFYRKNERNSWKLI
jgi:hypothetical protein